MENEIDLRQYIRVLIRHWVMIVSITVIAIIVAVLVSFTSAAVYEAKATVIITITRAEIVFEPKYRTYSLQEDKELRETLFTLVKSSSVAAEAIERLGDELELEDQSIRNILSKVTVNTSGDLIGISVKSTDPEEAVAIANAWAESYVSYVNALYADIPQSPEELQIQASAAMADYLERQREWESFMGNNTIDELTQQIADKELLINLKSLRDQIEAGSLSSAAAAANSLALLLLQTGAYATLPVQFQVPLDELLGLNANTEEQLHDIDSLIFNLESRSGGQPGQTIEELRQDILQLKRELEQQSAREKELKSSRDIAWQTYTTLANKVAEVEVASHAQDVVVRVAVDAIVPERSISSHRVTNIGIALVLGLIIGIFGAFGVDYFKNAKIEPKAEINEVMEEKTEARNNNRTGETRGKKNKA
jgi:capsular polysaccharide biosynthesis protein